MPQKKGCIPWNKGMKFTTLTKQESRIQYYQKNKQQILDKNKQYRIENKDKIKAQKHQHYEENKEQILAKHNQYRLDNLEEYSKRERERAQKSRKEFPEKEKGRANKYKKTPKGRIVQNRVNSKRQRELGFEPLNTQFEGSHGHHLDNINVIYIPKELNMSIPHDVYTGKNMNEINIKAWDYLEASVL